MKKIIFLCLIFVNLAYSYTYNDVLLKAQASIFPKIMLLDKRVEDKLIDGKIIYTIVYNKVDYDTALEISKFINENYHGYFDKYIYKINLVEFSKLSKDTEASAIYALNSSEKIDKVANFAKEKGIITFSYDLNNLKKGLLFSLVIEKSTMLYLNKDNLSTLRVNFVDSLLQIVKFVDTNDIKSKMLFNNIGLVEIYAKITSIRYNNIIDN